MALFGGAGAVAFQEGGQIVDMLWGARSAQLLDGSLRSSRKRIATLLEPFLMLLVGTLVLGIILSVLLPIFDLQTMVAGLITLWVWVFRKNTHRKNSFSKLSRRLSLAARRAAKLPLGQQTATKRIPDANRL